MQGVIETEAPERRRGGDRPAGGESISGSPDGVPIGPMIARFHTDTPDAKKRREAAPTDDGLSATPEARLASRLRELTARANDGVPGAVEELREFLQDHPEVWRHLGNLTELAEGTLLSRLFEGNATLRESMKRALEELRSGLTRQGSGRLEQLLVDQVVLTFLASRVAEIEAAGKCPPGTTATFRLKQAESAQKRHFDAIKALDQFSKVQNTSRPTRQRDTNPSAAMRPEGPCPEGTSRSNRDRPDGEINRSTVAEK